MRASPFARNFLQVLSYLYIHPFFSSFFSKSYPYFLSALAVANAVSRVVQRNKIGHRSCSHKQLMQVPLLSSARTPKHVLFIITVDEETSDLITCVFVLFV